MRKQSFPQFKSGVCKTTSMTPVEKFMRIFSDKTKASNKSMRKCADYKKEVYSNAMTTLQSCDTINEFGSRTYLKEQLGRKTAVNRKQLQQQKAQT